MDTNNSSFQEIPIIDIFSLLGVNDNPKSVRKTRKEIEDACKNIGFFYVKNHQIPQNHLDAVISVMEEFFNLPQEEKMKIHIGKSAIFRGYTPLGKELTNAKYDWHECVDFGLDLHPNHPSLIKGEQLAGYNQWPEIGRASCRERV